MSENVKPDLIEAIKEKSEATCAELLAEAEAYAAERAAAAKEFSLKLQEETEITTKRLAEDIAGKSRVASRMESNKIALGARRNAINRVYDLLNARLEKATTEEFLQILSALIEKYGEDGQKLLLSPSAPIDEKKARELKIVTERHIVVETSESVKNGFALCGVNYDRDFTYAAIVEAMREQTEKELAERLFGGER